MAFERKAATETAAPATKVATATTSKKEVKEGAAIWVNFNLVLQTKKGAKKISAGVAADSLFKKLFGDSFKQILEELSEEQLNTICNSVTFENLAINIVSPSEESSYEDLF